MLSEGTSAGSCRGLRVGRILGASIVAASLAAAGAGYAAPAEVTAATPATATAAVASQPSPSKCDRSKFRIILDVGHTAESYGAMSARKVPEFEFNLKLARRIEEKLKADGFTETLLLITEGKARPSLMKRVAVANRKGADLFLSIHHDSVPDIYVERWDFDGKKSTFNDLFGGYSVFVSRQNPHYEASLRFAKLVGNQMAARELQFARQYDQWFMGKYQRQLLDIDAGVYRYDELIVLRMTTMPAVLLESGSIINRDEELVMASDTHKNKVAAAVTSAAIEYCETRGTAPALASKPAPQVSKPPPRRVAEPQPRSAPRHARKR
ncbi:N-acetylmuramoyl-L-alanine amidase family protein [Bradyrhizobium lablabi]|uniref:N-acetylmuramoyl-L-alanine amidase family protein n=1 Tax=Bradyrhizobium lablabi TaxID=722472 RepID=UPI0020133A6A|nr:N-acetylmuramoyl-L-alanine amidase [Bradyrhizobium lablabi]